MLNYSKTARQLWSPIMLDRKQRVTDPLIIGHTVDHIHLTLEYSFCNGYSRQRDLCPFKIHYDSVELIRTHKVLATIARNLKAGYSCQGHTGHPDTQ